MSGVDTEAPVEADALEGLKLREPTGAVSYPVILVEGEEKAGKSYATCAFSSSPRVGLTFAAEWGGDGVLDEYGSLGPYRIIDHNGTVGDLRDQLGLAMRVPRSHPERPNVVTLDTASGVWETLKDRVDARARNSRTNVRKLQQDPDAEITRGMNLWNDATAEWYRLLNALLRYPGIVVLTARGKEVAEVENGEPTGVRTWKVEGHKNLASDVTAWVRLRRGQAPRLIACRSLHVDVPANGLELPRDGLLDHLVFEVLGAGGKFEQRNATIPSVGIASKVAKDRLVAYLQHQGLEAEAVTNRARAGWASAGLEGRKEVTEVEYEAALRFALPTQEADRRGDSPNGAAPAEKAGSDGARGSAPDDATVAPSGSEEAPVCEKCGEPSSDERPLFAEDDGKLYHSDCAPPPSGTDGDPDEAPFVDPNQGTLAVTGTTAEQAGENLTENARAAGVSVNDAGEDPGTAALEAGVDVCAGCSKPFTGGRGKKRLTASDGLDYHEDCEPY